MTEQIETYLNKICKDLELHQHCTENSRLGTYMSYMLKIMVLQEINEITMEDYIEYKHKIADILGV